MPDRDPEAKRSKLLVVGFALLGVGSITKAVLLVGLFAGWWG